MLSKKIICTVIALASYLLFTGFIEDCYQQLTLDVNASVKEFARDKNYCDTEVPSSGLCINEAGVSFNFNVNKNIQKFEDCCCDNNWPCC